MVNDDGLFCDDCGASDKLGTVWGFGSVITHDGQSRVYCGPCKQRRGQAYLFDARPWGVIDRDRKGSAA